MSVINSALEFSQIRVSQVPKYQELRIQISLDESIQESLESTLSAGVHTWREPFSFAANSVSFCQLHVLAKKRKFLCCAGRYKTIRATRLQSIEELLDTRSDTGVVRLPLYDSTKTDLNRAAIGSVEFLIAVTSLTSESLKHLSTRDGVSDRDDSCTPSLRFPYPDTVPEKPFLSLSNTPTSSPPCPVSTFLSPPSPLLHVPSNVPPQPPLRSPEALTPQYLQTTPQLPQTCFGYSSPKSGVDRAHAEMETYGDVTVHPEYVFSPATLPDEAIAAVPSLVDGEGLSGPAPLAPAEIGSFSPVICEPPEDISGSEPSSPALLHTTESALLPTPSGGLDQGSIPQISITLTKSSRGNSPLAPSTCESDATVKRPSVHVDTGSATHPVGVTSALSVSPGLVDELSPFSRSAILASPQPKTSTTNTSSSGLSPFSRTSMVESPSTTATTPAQSAVSEDPNGTLTSAPGPSTKQRKERPTIDTSCVGPRGQVRKYRNGSVPPVHVPVKLRNASLDLPRHHESEKFEPNPSMYSIAPSVSPGHFRKGSDLRPSTQSSAGRQGLAPSTRTRASSIRREPLEFDEAQICLDTANLGDQEVATFLKEVDAALSAVVNGTPAVAADSRAFLAVPSASSRFTSRHQSRKPSSQQLRADLSATVRSHEKEGTTRTGFSLVATSHPSARDVISSRATSPLSGHTDTVQKLLLSQVNMAPGSLPGSPLRSVVPATTFPLPQRVSPQPSVRQELGGWVPPSASARTRGRLQLSRPGSYYGDVNGNENALEVV